MKSVILVATLIQLGFSCQCNFQPDPNLFCDNPDWNAVQITVTKIPFPAQNGFTFVEATVGKVWGQGYKNVGEEMYVFREDNASKGCKVGHLLKPGFKATIWVEEHNTMADVSGCALHKFDKADLDKMPCGGVDQIEYNDTEY